MSKTIVVAYYPPEIYSRDNPIYAIQVIDSSIPSNEWLEHMKQESGIKNLKLCHTGWIEEWVPRKLKEPTFKEKYQLKECGE